MEGTEGMDQGVASLGATSGMGLEKRLHKSSLGREAEMFPRRLEWISVVLFIVNFFMMIYSYSLYEENEAWALTMTAVSTLTSILLLLSITFSIFGFRKLSQFSLGSGLMGLLISVASLGIRLMQTISEHNGYY